MQGEFLGGWGGKRGRAGRGMGWEGGWNGRAGAREGSGEGLEGAWSGCGEDSECGWGVGVESVFLLYVLNWRTSLANLQNLLDALRTS